MSGTDIFEQQSLIGTAVLDGQQHLISFNQKFSQLLGSELKAGLTLANFLSEAQRKKLQIALSGSAQTRQFDFVNTSRSSFDLLIEHQQLEAADRYLVFLVPALSQEQILRSIGQVAGKYGHDINNLLGSLRGVADLLHHKLLKLLGDPQPLEKQIQLMNTAIARSEELTRQMRGYVRQEQLPRSEVNLSALIAGLLELTAAAQKDPVETIFVCTDEFKVSANEFQLAQAFQSIISNSLDAVGKFKEKCLAIVINEVTFKGAESGRRAKAVEVVLIDHGKGMSTDSLNRALKALYSEKPGRIGSGLGLGLPMARQIIEDHAGSFDIRSKEDTGTTVIITLPLL